MGAEKSSEYYDNIFKDSVKYNCAPADSPYFMLWIKALAWINPFEKLVELCCGTGQFAELAVSLGYEYILGVDFSPEAIKKCQNIKATFQVKDVVCDNVFSFPHFDTVICFEGLEHITDDLLVIDKIPRGKRFIFSVPNFDDPAHVRTFKDIIEIMARYEMVDLKNCFEYQFPGEEAKIFLIDSIKK